MLVSFTPQHVPQHSAHCENYIIIQQGILLHCLSLLRFWVFVKGTCHVMVSRDCVMWQFDKNNTRPGLQTLFGAYYYRKADQHQRLGSAAQDPDGQIPDSDPCVSPEVLRHETWSGLRYKPLQLSNHHHPTHLCHKRGLQQNAQETMKMYTSRLFRSAELLFPKQWHTPVWTMDT